MPLPNFDVFQILPILLRSFVLWEFVRQLLGKVFSMGYQVSFYSWQIKPVLKHCKLQKYYN